MTRGQLEHIIRAAAANADVREIVVIDSQAILGAFPDAPSELTQSMEADVFPKDHPPRSIVIDGSIGELSLFHETFGYYAHGVDETTATLPDGWRQRLIRIDTPGTAGAVGWTLEPHDLAVSKLAAGREKDFRFVETMIRARMVSSHTIRERLEQTVGICAATRELAHQRLQQWDSGS